MSSSEEIARELEAFYVHYIEVFNREDDRFFDCFTLPYASVSGGQGLTVVANDADHRKGVRRTMSILKERGWARSGIDSVKAWAMADNLGMIISAVTRYRTDRSILEKVRALYMVRRDGDDWKIVTITEIKPPFLAPGDIPR